jgi:cytochrome c oxidase assembly protein subunit 11
VKTFDKNAKTLGLVLALAAGMVVLAFASVPLYRKICQVTGWGGTTQEVKANPFEGQTFERKFAVRFNADTDTSLPWTFKPDQISVEVRAGQTGLATFMAKNDSRAPVTGTAIYNVTPLQAGKYFYKTQCFCFGQQTLKPGQTVHMPVAFFVNPAIMQDRELRDLKTITLSYTFYRTDSAAYAGALENFMNKTDNRPEK